MKKLVVVFALLLMLVLGTFSTISAVTDGELDGNNHPQVVLLLMEVDHQPAFRCSGTLLSPTVLLTAGHCTNNYPDSPYTGMRVFTESDVQAGQLAKTNNYPYAGPNAVEAVSWASLPLYPESWIRHDAGVVVLQEPGVVLPPDKYGKLPSLNEFDSFKTQRGQQDIWFTSVGYGRQESFPTAAAWKNVAVKTRYVAYPRLLQINVPGFTGSFSMLLSNNAATGGTCFGDSGGPNFLRDTNVVAGITSFGINSNCAGTGGVFRTDREEVLNFVNSYLH